MQHLIPLLVPHGQGDVEGAEGQDDSRGWGGKGTSRGILSRKEPSFPHGLPQLLLAQHFLQEPQQGWHLAWLSCYPTARVPKADISLLML